MDDTNKVIKCKLKNVLDVNLDYDFLYSIINKANNNVFICYHFIRAYILNCFNNNRQLPDINKEFILACFKVISIKSCGPKSKNKLYNSLKNYYEKTFCTKVFGEIKYFDSKNLSYINGEFASEMVTSYCNNIELNFYKYVSQFINQNFKDDKNIKKDKSILWKIKKDVIYGTSESDKKYHKWIKKYKKLILPNDLKITKTNIKKDHSKYLKCMLYMNKFLEDNKLKTFQPICLRTDVKDKYVHFNTNAIVDIIPTIKNKNNYFKNIRNMEEIIWKNLFKLNIKKLKLKNYSFNNRISTDGLSISVYFIKNNKMEDKNIKLNNIKKGRDNKRNNKNSKKNNKKDSKEDNKKDSKKDKKKNIKKDGKVDEFQYIEDLIKLKNFNNKLKNAKKEGKLVYGDPGEKSILKLMSETGEFYDYTTKRRIKETKRKQYNKLIENKKNKIKINNKTIKNYEKKLTSFNKNTINEKDFLKYTKQKLSLKNKINNEKTYNEYLKKLKWFSYINTKRQEDKLLNELENKYGKSIFIIGDYGGRKGLKTISTPKIGIKRLLKRRFEVYHINEFNTSKLNCYTEKENSNLKVTYKNSKNEEKEKSLHSVLTYKMSNNRIGCINRDTNAVKNMQKITAYLLDHKERPKKFTQNKILQPV